jgi:hypothetical protein
MLECIAGLGMLQNNDAAGDERVKATRLKSIKEGRRQPGRGEEKQWQSTSE